MATALSGRAAGARSLRHGDGFGRFPGAGGALSGGKIGGGVGIITSWESSWLTFEGENTSDQTKALPASLDDRLILARRLVAERCVYGVDKNPLAVEIAKLSLWLVTLAKDLPFTFLDHALKCGDSLVGASAEDYLRWAHGWQAAEATLFDEQLQQQLETARQKRRQLESFVVRDVQDAERKAGLLGEAEAALAHIKRGADLLTGTRLLGLKAQEVEDLQINLLFPYMAGELDGEIDATKHPDAARALHAAHKERAFHWEFEFPEVFEQGGFDVFVGNPPYIGGQKISGIFGDNYRSYVVSEVGRNAKGSADICGYFLLRSWGLAKENLPCLVL